eukprot:11251429-Karenia_brevis.AAC.1
MTVVHPFDRTIKVPSRIAQSWHNIAVLGPQGICNYRRHKLDQYRQVASELEAQEKQIHAALHPDVET